MSERRRAIHVAVSVLLGLLLAGCGSGGSPAGSTGSPATLAPPDRIRTAGTVSWCSNLEYPLFESVPPGGTEPEGIDIDIAAEIARRWGVASVIRPTSWNNLLPTLAAGDCDLVISGMTTTVGDRATRADFVEYLTTWTDLIVAAGNPRAIRTVDDLAGRSVGAAPGYKAELDVRAASDALVAAGKPAVVLDTFHRSDEEWVERLAAGQTDALAIDSTEISPLFARAPYTGAAEAWGGPRLSPAPVGIGVRKGDAGMKEAVAAAIAEMYADGTMKSLVDKWGLTDAVGLL